MNMGRMGFDSRRMSDCCLFRVRFCLNIRCKCKHGTAAITSPMVVVVAKGGGGGKGCDGLAPFEREGKVMQQLWLNWCCCHENYAIGESASTCTGIGMGMHCFKKFPSIGFHC